MALFPVKIPPAAPAPAQFTAAWASHVASQLQAIAAALNGPYDVNAGIITMPVPVVTAATPKQRQVWVGRDGVLRLSGLGGLYTQNFVNQSTAVTVTHSLGTLDVIVTLVDINGNTVSAGIRVLNDNQVEIHPAASFTGRAVISGALPYGKHVRALSGVSGLVDIEHSLGTENLHVSAWDSALNRIDAGVQTLNADTVRLNFGASFTGRVVILAAGTPSSGRSAQAFTAASGIFQVHHNLGTPDIVVALAGGPGVSATVRQITQHTVEVNFALAFTGRVVVFA